MYPWREGSGETPSIVSYKQIKIREAEATSLHNSSQLAPLQFHWRISRVFIYKEELLEDPLGGAPLDAGLVAFLSGEA